MQEWKEPIHPGEILADELEFIGANASLLAANIEMQESHIYQVILQKRGITADTALKLAVFFGTTPDFWLNLQKSYEFDKNIIN